MTNTVTPLLIPVPGVAAGAVDFMIHSIFSGKFLAGVEEAAAEAFSTSYLVMEIGAMRNELSAGTIFGMTWRSPLRKQPMDVKRKSPSPSCANAKPVKAQGQKPVPA